MEEDCEIVFEDQLVYILATKGYRIAELEQHWRQRISDGKRKKNLIQNWLQSKLEEYDTFKINWNDPGVPDGFITFDFKSKGNVISFHLDQPNLFDVDSSEINIKKKPINFERL